jgi:hypothetical protein
MVVPAVARATGLGVRVKGVRREGEDLLSRFPKNGIWAQVAKTYFP